MPFPPSPVDLESHAERRATEVDYYGGVLKDLVDIGIGLARTIQFEVGNQTQLNTADAYGASDKTPGADAAAAFERVSRSVRLSIMLARALSAPEVVQRDAPAGRVAVRARVIRDVEDRIGRRGAEPERDALRAELRERMERPETERELANRPVAEVIEEICRDLGIETPPGMQTWMRRTPADVVALQAWAARPLAPGMRAAGDAVREDPVWPRGQAHDWVDYIRDG